MMAAGTAARRGKSVLLLEKNEKLGKKLYITGKGRCNVTNSCDCEEFLANVVRNPRFLYSAVYAFPPSALCELIEAQGVPLKVERGRRVFPESDKASDIIKALASYIKNAGAEVMLNTGVNGIEREETGFIVHAGENDFHAGALVLAAGGLSYPSTGSTGDGLEFARKAGHNIIKCRPALVPLNLNENFSDGLSGVSLKNVELCACCKGRELFRERGELLFTHFGLSGPLALSMSSVIDKPAECEIFIDFKPAVTMDELEKRIINELNSAGSRQIKTALSGMLISALRAPVLQKAGVDADMRANQLSREARRALASAIKRFELAAAGYRDFNEAVITRGGVNVKEVDPATMQSKIVPGLYFAGEMLDVDGFTGGYNLQIAFSTGYLAGESV